MDVKDGLLAIAGEVLGDVQKEAEAIILDAQKEAKKALEAAKAQANQTYASLVKEQKAKAESECQRIISVIEVEARNYLLQIKERLVDEAFEQAQNKLNDFSQTQQYRDYLLRCIEGDAKKIGAKNVTVQINSKDTAWLTLDSLKTLSKKIEIELTLSEQTGEFLGGCRVQSQDRKIIYDSTFDSRLQELKSSLRTKVAKTLFEEAT